ncbi:nicotinamide-nucleotide amidase [Rhodobium orientis]|uniref:Damage-inducible protein CinA n=1 Tax=Rhodobium orientis TaxID=34017 RepID=A0A327JT70_9HYPH|nr:CinA family protein [Rhodobium orientis]MBB4302465.1 nicotinamide-nucleotide amidase [Rhodobium orientis]MBK5949314.1 damage-inducible protein CinA [Rhodobium orientis]RAI28696.1 damage-inducible protein CinA [Rhodobium orientis]
MADQDFKALATSVLDTCRAKGLMVATAESCTGGLIAGMLTEIAGSSDVVERGFVTYSNEAKTEMLGVPADLIEAHGAVSEAVARAMAEGAIAQSPADISVAVTGVAGPGGGSPEKPVGLVHLAASRRGGETVHLERRYGDIGRAAVRAATVADALKLIEELAVAG